MITMKYILKIVVIIIIVKIIFFAISKFNFHEEIKQTQKTQSELIHSFLNEFVINNKFITYPVKINDSLSLMSRSVLDDDKLFYVVENYILTSEVSLSKSEIKDIEQELTLDIKRIYCTDEEVKKREHLFTGYSSVGLIENIMDTNGKLLVSIKINRQACNK